MKNKILATIFQGNCKDSLGEFSNTSYSVSGAERIKKNVKTTRGKTRACYFSKITNGNIFKWQNPAPIVEKVYTTIQRINSHSGNKIQSTFHLYTKYGLLRWTALSIL